MATVQTEIVIAAPPEAVWAVLSDSSQFTEWSDVLLGLEGPLAVGGTVRLTIDVGLRTVREDVVLRTVEPGRELAWGKTTGPGRAMDFHHGIRLDRHGDHTLVTHYEHFTGWFGSVIGLAIAPMLRGRYRRFDAQLRERVEAGDPKLVG